MNAARARVTALSFMTLGITGCFDLPKSMQSKNSSTLTTSISTTVVPAKFDENGKKIVELDINSGMTQVVTASQGSNIQGAAVSFPPGSLAIATDIVVEEGTGLNPESVASELGLSSDINLVAASPSLVVMPTTFADPVGSIAIEIPVDSSALRLNNDTVYYNVAFKVIKYAVNQTFAGLYPHTEVQFKNGKVLFNTPFFGEFKVLTSSKPVEKPAETVSMTKIVTKTEQNQQAPLAVKSVRPFVVAKNETVTLSGSNFRNSMTLAIAGQPVNDMTIKSDVSASFVMPATVEFGLHDISVTQDGTTNTIKLFAQADRSGFPLITLEPSGVCSGVTYIDANGDKQTGTKICSATTGDMLKSNYDKDNDGEIDTAKNCSTAGHATTSSSTTEATYASVAAWAAGVKGSDITASSSLNIPANGSFFKVNGGGTVNGIIDMPAGTRITLQFTQSTTLTYKGDTSPKFLLGKSENATVGAGDVFEFLSLGNGDWQELLRATVPVTFIAKRSTSAQSIAGSATANLIFNDEVQDPDAAFNVSTGTYTAPVNGYYEISITPSFSNSAFTGGYCSNYGPGTYLNIDGISPIYHNSPVSCPAGLVTYNQMQYSGYLTAGANVYVSAQNWSTDPIGFLPATGNLNTLKIVRKNVP